MLTASSDPVGYALLIGATMLFASIVFLPYFGLSTAAATVVGGMLIIVGEGAFIAGAALIGPRLWRRVRNRW